MAGTNHFDAECASVLCIKEASAAWVVGILALAILAIGFYLLIAVRKGKLNYEGPDVDPLGPYVLQILGLAFLLPVILVIGATGLLKSEAITALLGAIVGYLFGTGRSAVESQKSVKTTEKEK